MLAFLRSFGGSKLASRGVPPPSGRPGYISSVRTLRCERQLTISSASSSSSETFFSADFRCSARHQLSRIDVSGDGQLTPLELLDIPFEFCFQARNELFQILVIVFEQCPVGCQYGRISSLQT